MISHLFILEEILIYNRPKWNANNGSIIDRIDHFIENKDYKFSYEYENSYLKATKKQIERRGTIGLFKSHKN